MMPGGVRWLAGREEVQRAVDAWRSGTVHGEVLRDNPRRRLVRLAESGAGDLLIKHFRVGSGRHGPRERWKARLGRSPAGREHRVLVALRARGLTVPEPFALGELPDGDRLLVLGFVHGVPLEEVVAAPRRVRERSLEALGSLVRRLHHAGFVHGDLHAGNLLFTADGPVLLDLQHARRTHSEAAWRRDLGDLDYSLWDRVGLADRIRVRAAALDLAAPFGPSARVRLRAVGHAARERARRHGRSRTRRSLRSGRLYREIRLGDGARGMRVRDVSEADVADALASHRQARAAGDERLWKHDGRSRVTAVVLSGQPVLVKEVPPRGLPRMVADLLRGSPARRAWLGGHGLLARGIGAARPLAFVEHRKLGVPVASWIVLERLDPTCDAVEETRRDPARALAALGRLVRRLHLRDVDHGDLKATHVILGPADPPEVRLVDLEGVRFPRRLSDARRLRALGELNASLPDEAPASLRRALFGGYAVWLPFRAGARRALEEVVKISLARRHRWTGVDCPCAAALRGERTPPGSQTR